MSKRARRFANRAYSHTEPILRHEKIGDKIVRTEVVGYTDVTGSGRSLGVRQTEPYEIKSPKPPRPARRDNTNDEE